MFLVQVAEASCVDCISASQEQGALQCSARQLQHKQRISLIRNIVDCLRLTCMPVLPLSAQGVSTAVNCNRFSLILVLTALMAVNCATTVPVAIGTPLDHALAGVEPGLVSFLWRCQPDECCQPCAAGAYSHNIAHSTLNVCSGFMQCCRRM